MDFGQRTDFLVNLGLLVVEWGGIAASKDENVKVKDRVPSKELREILGINTIINTTSVGEWWKWAPYMGTLAEAGWAWSARAVVESGHGWLGMVTTRQAQLSGRLGAMGRCVSTAGRSSRWYNLATTAKHIAMVWAYVVKRRHWFGWRNVWNMRSRAADRGRPKRMGREVVQKDWQAHNLNREDAMYRSRWKKLIKVGWWSGWWVGKCFFWYQLTRVVPDKGS